MKKWNIRCVILVLAFSVILFCFNGPVQAKGLEWSGCIEADMLGSEQKDRMPSKSESNIVLDTLELVLEAEVNDNVSAMAIIKYEGGDDVVVLDEANLTLKNAALTPLTLTAGKYVLPFGVFESHLVNDPLTQEIYEINTAGISLAYVPEGMEGVEVSATVYESQAGVNDLADYILNASFAQEELYNLSIYYNSAKAESGFDRDDSMGVSLNTAAQNVTFDAEYITAFNREGDNPEESAYSISVAYQLQPTTELVARYEDYEDDIEGNQETDPEDPAQGLDYRYSLGANYELYENATLSAEYRISEPEAENTVSEWTLRLSVEF